MDNVVSGIPIEPNDKLIIQGIFVSANVMTMFCRVTVLIDGKKQYFSYRFNPVQATYTTQSYQIELPEGILIACSLIVQSTSRLINTYYATLSLGRYSFSAVQPYMNLVSGYLELGRPLIWTFAGPCQNDVYPANYQLWTTGGAVGGEASWGLWGTAKATPISLYLKFVADANVHNRLITLQLKLAAQLIMQWEVQHVITASETHYLFFNDQFSAETVIGNNIYIPFKPFSCPGVYSMATLTDGIQAGDQYTVVCGFSEHMFQA